MEDSEILQLYFDRKEEAISATAEKYGPYCTAIARNILTSIEDAEECVNDTYLKTWNAVPPDRPRILSAFLGKLTRNLAFNRYKYNMAQKRIGGGQLPLVLEELENCIPSQATIEHTLDYNALVKDINDFLGTLSTEKRTLFLRRYFYTDSIDELSRIYGMSYSNLTMTLSRLRSKLRTYLASRGYTL